MLKNTKILFITMFFLMILTNFDAKLRKTLLIYGQNAKDITFFCSFAAENNVN